MYDFRKKPVVIQAFQMTPERRDYNREWPEWLNQAFQVGYGEVGGIFPASRALPNVANELAIWTLEGVHLVSFGDWIIRGVKGEIYPCKPEIFAMTYDPANTGD